ncbi:hypothetical protein BBP40_009817 [Aspergillus hancockii]|nr:hypothetical protein BBP40_009817 [Aspergillus hancockii]
MSPQMELSSDGLMTSEYALGGDPASFLGLQFGPDPAVIPHNHLSMLKQWPSYHHQASSPPPQPLDAAQYTHPRFTSNQDAWNPLQVTGVPVSTSAWGFSQASRARQTSELGRKYSTGQYSTTSETGSHLNGFHPSDSGYSSRSCTTRSVTTSSYAIDSASSPHLAPHEHEPEDRTSMLDLGPSHCGDTVVDIMEMVESPSLLSHDVIKCDYPNCPWTGKCPSDKRGKEWPRLDNFRQHLSRMHSDEVTSELLKRSHDWYDTCVKPRVAASSSFVDYFSEVPGVSESEYARRGSGQDLCSLGSPTPPLFQPSDHSTLQLPEGFQVQRRASTLSYASTMSTEATPRLDLASLNLSSTIDPETSAPSHPDNPQHGQMEEMVSEMATNMVSAMARMMNNGSGSDNGNNQRRHSQEVGDIDELVEQDAELSDQKREMIQKILSAALNQVSGKPDPIKPRTQTVSGSKSDQKGWIQCEFCAKRTRLRCEMKKHKKRHERPYGCTFERCNKTFGSKADWKRHENSQHFHLQSWRCTLSDATQGGMSCARLFYRQEVYVQHLIKNHQIEDDEVQAALSKNHIGRDGQSQFWCGFCRDIIPLTGQGLAAWNERFNHIDTEHFKNGERIGDWLLPSGHLTKSREREEGKVPVGTNAEGDGQPITDDISDDDSASSIYESESENLRDETVMAGQAQAQDLSLRRINSHLHNSSTMFDHLPEATNLRKRKFSAPQPSLDYYLRADIPTIEKRYKTDDAIDVPYGKLVYCVSRLVDRPV